MAKMGRPKKKASERKSRIITIRLTPTKYRELKTFARCTELKTMNAVIHHCLNVGLQRAEAYSPQPRMKLTPVPEDLLPPRKPRKH
jgi:hypothetical protein